MSIADYRLSVIIATRNRADFVADAIDSVLAQPHANLEILVVDDGSVDGTAEVVGKYPSPVRYIYREQAGPSASRNYGIKLATGDFLGFLDDDDVWSPDKLAVQLPPLLHSPDVEIVLGHTQRMIRERGEHSQRKFVSYQAPVRLYSLGCALFRPAVFDRVGMLDERMLHAEDDDWFMRARSLRVRMLFLSEVTLYYRFHESNMSYDKKEKMPYMLRLVKNRLDRIRSGEE